MTCRRRGRRCDLISNEPGICAHAIIVKSYRADIRGLRPDQLPFGKLLNAMCGPSENSSNGEGPSEQFGRQSQTMQQQRRVELDVGVVRTGFSLRVLRRVIFFWMESSKGFRLGSANLLNEVPFGAAA